MKTFTYNIFINATPETVWEALTSADFSRQYWRGREIRSEWTVGAKVALVRENGMTNWEGVILTYDPYTTMSYTFDASVDPNYAGEPPSKVAFYLKQSASATQLTIVHEELSDTLEKAVSGGWAWIVSSMKSLLETGKPLPSPQA